MGKLLWGQKLDEAQQLLFYCPGCRCYHLVTVGRVEHGPSWAWNDDEESPTFSPSILVNRGTDRQCHLFVKNGSIEFLSDCVHELRGQTVPMQDED